MPSSKICRELLQRTSRVKLRNRMTFDNTENNKGDWLHPFTALLLLVLQLREFNKLVRF